jgi:hypothetical protein
MVLPTPAIPTFTDGLIVHANDLNALAANLTNLYNYNQASFTSQRPCVIAKQTTGQAIANITDTLITFQSAAVNTDNMWTASVPSQITIQHAGIYFLFAQVRWPTIGSPTFATACALNLMVNGTNAGVNTIASQLLPFVSAGAGSGEQCGVIVNLAVGATVFVDAWQSSGGSVTLPTNFGGTFLGAIFLTSST